MKLEGKELGAALTDGAALSRKTAGNFAPTSKAAIVGNTAAALLDLAARFARQGFSPVEHITRLVDLGASIDAARADVDAAAEEKWPDEPTAPATPSALPPPLEGS